MGDPGCNRRMACAVAGLAGALLSACSTCGLSLAPWLVLRHRNALQEDQRQPGPRPPGCPSAWARRWQCSLVLMSRRWVTRSFSPSPQDRRRMGSGGRGVSICSATWKHRCRPVPDPRRDHLAHCPSRERSGSDPSGGNWNLCGYAADGRDADRNVHAQSHVRDQRRPHP